MPKQLDRALREADAGRQSDKASNHLLLAAREQYRILVQNSHGVIYDCGHLSEPLPRNLASQLNHHADTAPFEQLRGMAVSMRASFTPFLEKNLQLEKPQ